MKKIVYVFVLISFLSFYAQDENANWIFAKNSKLKFTNNLANLSNSGQLISTEDEVASISDEVGNLLFYTDGKSVWDKNNNIMQNGNNSLAHTTLANYIYNPKEPVTILPIPNSNKYYIFTEKVTLYDVALGFWSNYYFSIVDMDQNNGLGSITSLNNLLISSFDIDSSGYIKHHNVSTAMHSDGLSYWLILKPNQNFYTFHITDTILQSNPSYITSSINCNQLQAKTSCSGSSSSEYSLKSSPDSSKLGLVASPNSCFVDSYLNVYDFNNSSGLISNCNTSYHEPSLVSLEFSADSNFIYVLRNNFNQELLVFDISNILDIHKKFTLISTNPNQIPLGNSIQRGIDNKIYFLNKFSTEYLWEVSNPNNPLTTSVSETNYFNANNFGSFPRLIPFDSCTKTFYTDVVFDNITFSKSVEDDIYSSNYIKNSSDIAYDAGSKIVLEPGFRVESGSLFNGFIGGCSNTSAKVATGKKVKQNKLIETIIYPNPTQGIFTVSTINLITNYKIIDQLGKVISAKNNINKKNLKIDIKNYPKGIYYLSLLLEDGKFETRKILKK